MDRKSIRPDNRPTKRISEARPSIERYPCKGKIAITININIRQAKVKIKHLIPHEHATYRESNLMPCHGYSIISIETSEKLTFTKGFAKKGFLIQQYTPIAKCIIGLQNFPLNNMLPTPPTDSYRL